MNKEIAEAVYAHAQEHYEEGGWSTIVECYSIRDLIEKTEGEVLTVSQAIKFWSEVVGVWADVEEDIRAEARAAGADEEWTIDREDW